MTKSFFRRLVLAISLLGTVASSGFAQDEVIPFQKDRAWQDLVKQVDFGPRPPETEAHIQCRDYIVKELKATCENVQLQPFEHTWSRNGKVQHMWNITAEQNWKDAKVRVALVTHWDTRPSADQEQDPANRLKPIPGADDGASGTAVLLELARALHETPSNVGVMYVMVDGEDLGPELDEMFLGADYFAKNPPTPKPDYGILLDMIGNRGLRVPKEPNSEKYAFPLEQAFYLYAAHIGLRDTFPNIEGPEIEDDHLTLNQHGIPTIDLIDFSYAQWHTLQDTPEHCSPESLYKVGYMLFKWLHQTEPFVYKAQ